MLYEIVTRTQHSVGSSMSQFGGPDHYIALVAIPDEGELVGSHPLSGSNILKYGWQVVMVREYYGKNLGARSAYGKAMAEFYQFIEQNKKRQI